MSAGRDWFLWTVYDRAGGMPYQVSSPDICKLLRSLPEVSAVSVFHPIRRQWESLDDATLDEVRAEIRQADGVTQVTQPGE